MNKFNFDVLLSKNTLKASESFQAKIKVSGEGNLKLFKLPSINVPNTLEVYEPEYEEKVKITLSGMKGTIVDNYTIVPQFQGKYPIPSVQFSYFDPKSASYKTLTSQNQLVNVFEGPTAGVSRANVSVSENKQQIIANDNAFRFIKLDTKLKLIDQEMFWMSNRFWAALISPLILFVIAYLIKLFVLDKKEDISSSKQRRAQQLAKKYLSSAKKVLNDQPLFYEAMERALHNYLKAKLSIETTELSKAKIESLLLKKKVEKQIALDFVTVIENCELARYAPGSSVNIQADFKKASKLIASIDRQL